MKNLKKILALVLVIAMAFSFMAMGSAAFTDQKDIKYTTAVGVMTGIGAINGYTDGSFKPAGLVTRAEAAKMIAYAILGPQVAAALSTSTSSFTDVPATHWASPFIEYCVTQGIINGRGDGTFDPNGNVTGFEIAKMMLCAAGYGKNDEYVGANWQINVAKDAMQKGIFNGNESGNFAAPATREEAALYIFNGITRVGQVDYNELFGYYGKGSSVTAPGAGNTIAKDLYKMADTDTTTAAIDPVKGIVTGGTVNGKAKTGTYVARATINPDTGKVTDLDTPELFKFDAAVADLGQLISVFYNTETGKVYYTETLSTTIVSLFGVTTAYNYVQTFGSATFTTGVAVVEFSNSYDVVEIHKGTNAANALQIGAAGDLDVGNKAPAGTYAIYGGEIISFASNPAMTFEKVLSIKTTAGAEAIVFSTKTLSNTANNDLVREYEGIAVNDYVTLTQIGSIYTVGKTTTVDGVISKVENIFGLSWNAWFPPSLTMDGKVYNASQATGTVDLNDEYPDSSEEFANTYTLYLDESGNWIVSVLKSGANASSVVYVTGPEWAAPGEFSSTVYKVQAVNAAGEQVVYTAATNPNVTGGFYKVTVDATTKMATFNSTIIPATDFADVPAAQTLALTTVKNGTNYYFASDCNFIFVSGTGANLKITKVTGIANVVGVPLGDPAYPSMLYFNNTQNPNKTVSAVIINRTFTGATTAKTLYFKSSATSLSQTTVDGVALYTYTAYIDGVRTTITARDSSLSNVDGAYTSVKGKFATYTVDANGVYDITGVASGTNIFTNDTVNRNYIFNGQISTVEGDTAKVAADAIVHDFATSSSDPAIYTTVGAMEAVTNKLGFCVSYVKNTDGDIKILYVEATSSIAFSGLPSDADFDGLLDVAGTAPYDLTLSPTATGMYDATGITYQWYTNTIPSTTGGTAIPGATSATLTVDDLAAGTYYYYLVAKANSGEVSAVTSVIKVVVS